jgi:hypothetical protein
MTNLFIDFYIILDIYVWNTELIEDDLVRVIVQRYEMIIFTNKGEILNEPNLGRFT